MDKMSKNTLSRRRFIRMGLLGSGSILLLSRCNYLSATSNWRFFTEKEATIVDAIVEQIIPTDEWSGAKDAGVTNYIDKQLVGPLSRHQQEYRISLAAVEASCIMLFQKSFEALSWEIQTDFLKKMERGKLSESKKEDGASNKIWDGGADRAFFNLIRRNTMQGFYGSPRHGGNKNYVSYKMVGLDYPFIIGQNRYKS